MIKRILIIYVGVVLSLLFLLIWISREQNYYTQDASLGRNSRVLSEMQPDSSGDTTTINYDPTPTPDEQKTTTSSNNTETGNYDDTSSTVNTSDPTPTPTPTYSETDTSTSTTTSTDDASTTDNTENLDSTDDSSASTEDRFIYFDKDTVACIKEVLESYEEDIFRFLQPTTTQEEEELKRILNKASICNEESTTTISNEPSPIDDETKECLIRLLSEQVFEEVQSQQREPTEEERRVGEQCFEDSDIAYTTIEQDVDQDTRKCLVDSLGEERYQLLIVGESIPKFEERKDIDICLGIAKHPLEKTRRIKTPIKINNCLVETLGENRANLITSGKSVPTQSEREQASVCFQDISKEKQRLIPVMPAQVPFLEQTHSSTLDVGLVRTKRNIESKDSVKVTLQGKGPVNSVVDIYVFSDPIVVTTKTDSNGDWVYEFSGGDLEEGEHVAYVTARTQDGRSVRSSVYSFEVFASDENSQQLLDEQDSTVVGNRFLRIALFITILAVFFVAVGAIYISSKRMERAAMTANDKSGMDNDQESANGENDSETASSTVD